MRILIILIAALMLAACQQAPQLPAIISPYQIDVQQGNVVTQEMIDKLKAGQTRSQVRFVLGSPLVTDMFHSDRWDYIYLLQRQGKADERRRLTVIFDGDKLLRLEGDVVATDKVPQLPAQKPVAAKPGTAPVAATPTSKPEKPAGVTPAGKADAAKADPPAAAENKDPPKRGLFGRMLEKIGL